MLSMERAWGSGDGSAARGVCACRHSEGVADTPRVGVPEHHREETRPGRGESKHELRAELRVETSFAEGNKSSRLVSVGAEPPGDAPAPHNGHGNSRSILAAGTRALSVDCLGDCGADNGEWLRPCDGRRQHSPMWVMQLRRRLVHASAPAEGAVSAPERPTEQRPQVKSLGAPTTAGVWRSGGMTGGRCGSAHRGVLLVAWGVGSSDTEGTGPAGRRCAGWWCAGRRPRTADAVLPSA